MPIDPNFLVPGGALNTQLLGHIFEAETDLSGTHVGPYRIVELIAEGGMGAVYRALRADGAYEQEVAIKRVASAKLRGDRAELLKRERQALARLEHPGIARLLDGGSADDGSLWFAMDYVRGQPIDTWVRAQQPAEAEVLRALVGVCEALAHAHRALLIHRDIKPANVLVDKEGRVRLVDFGIGALIGADEAAPRAYTPGYASPEQVRGDPEGTATDIYQVGRLLVEMRALLGSQGRLAHADCIRVDQIAARATADHPAARYAETGALARDLRAVLERKPISLRPDGVEALRLYGRRQAPLVATIAVAAMVLVAVIVVAFVRVDNARQVAETQAEAARRAAETTQRISSFLTGLLVNASPAVNQGRQLTVSEALGAAVSGLRADMDAEPHLRGELLAMMGNIYLTREENAAALPLLAEAVQLALRDTGLAAERRALRHRLYGIAALGVGDYPLARAQLETARTQFEALADGEAMVLRTMRNLALLSLFEGDLNGAIDAAAAGIARLRARGEGAESDLAADLINYGRYLAQADRIDEASAVLREALQLCLKHHGERHPFTVHALAAEAELRIEHADDPLALDALRQARALTLELSGLNSPPHIAAEHALARGLLKLGQLDDADEALAVAMVANAALPVGDAVDTVGLLETLGGLRLAQGQVDAAIVAYMQMLEADRTPGKALNLDLGQRSMALARAYLAANDPINALAALGDARYRAAERAPKDHRLHAQIAALAEQIGGAGRSAEAADSLRPND